MIGALEHLAQDHIGPLVALAVIVSLCSATISLELFKRGRAGVARWAWIAAAGLVAGAGIWTTHFIATLAWRPGTAVGYAPGLTTLSIVLAVGGAALCFGLTALTGAHGQILTGALMGLVIGVMHHTGMAAVQTDAVPHWDLGLVGLCLVLGAGFGALSLRLAANPRQSRQWLAPAAFAELHGGVPG